MRRIDNGALLPWPPACFTLSTLFFLLSMRQLRATVHVLRLSAMTNQLQLLRTACMRGQLAPAVSRLLPIVLNSRA